MTDLLLWTMDLAPFLARLWQLVKVLLTVTAVAMGNLAAIAATTMALFGDDSTEGDHDPRKALAQRNRADFITKGRWVTVEQIRQDIEEMEPPLYTPTSARN